ncbi:uncharacterized protein YcbK (DUF882 family) [Gemmobacter caeni]|uniref:Murein endopeptidase K n=1 Tax=Gemmobacter caeni TaxID=589035 RepID=A0A2T6B8T5_9RHOB|nr:uncharacterized protein YcbK (DUF882 family) [Gemmobacter caeni]TWJ02838.1 uncharacterized protein YcbK (DUF882 family) [Gemmobacter caeni]
MLSRRQVVFGSVAAAAASAIGLPAFGEIGPETAPSRPTSRLDQLVSAIRPELRMFNANTNERMSARFYGPTGYDPVEIRRINWFMRDWRESEMKQVDVRLLWALAAIRQAAMKDGHDGEVRFLSGYRSRKTNDLLRRLGYGAAEDSLHISARANDFSLPGVPMWQVAEYARWLEVGGVGHYPGSFVHIDSGQIRHWEG